MTEQAVETLILVEGQTLPANLQPPQSDLQGAFRKAPGQQLGIVIDMDAALPIAQDLVRQARAVAFAQNDAATMMATQRADSEALEACRVRGDRLRDAPSDARLTAAATAEALLAAVAEVTAEF